MPVLVLIPAPVYATMFWLCETAASIRAEAMGSRACKIDPSAIQKVTKGNQKKRQSMLWLVLNLLQARLLSCRKQIEGIQKK